jgi:hypothetical protein
VAPETSAHRISGLRSGEVVGNHGFWGGARIGGCSRTGAVRTGAARTGTARAGNGQGSSLPIDFRRQGVMALHKRARHFSHEPEGSAGNPLRLTGTS